MPVSHHPQAQTPPPTPATPAIPALPAAGPNDQPLAVVKVLSVRGIEYLMMTLALWVGAAAITGIILSLINGGRGFDVLALPVSALVVAAVLFSGFFLRLKKAELQNPALRFDPSKRRLSQITQIFTYVVSFISLVGIVYVVLAKIGGSFTGAVAKVLLDFVVVLIVSGGILAYYWIDEHRGR